MGGRERGRREGEEGEKGVRGGGGEGEMGVRGGGGEALQQVILHYYSQPAL